MTTPAVPHRQRHKPVYTGPKHFRQRCEACGAIREMDEGRPLGPWWLRGYRVPQCPGEKATP